MLKGEIKNCLICVLGFCFVLLITGARNVFSDTVVDNVAITVPKSCTLSSTAGSGEVYNVSMEVGQYKNDIGDTTLSVFCNDANGFSIYAIGFSDDEYGNTKMITDDTDVYIATGTATSGNTSNWAMKLTSVASAGAGVYTPTIVSPFNSFASVPTSYAQVATVNPATDSGTSAQVKATYAVFISTNQIAKTYTGRVKYTIVSPASQIPNEPRDTAVGYIGYYPNAGNSVVDTMSDQAASANAEVELWASNFQRPGYGFVGWSDAFDYVANVGSESNPNAHIYGPNETIVAPSNIGSKGLSLYAVWVKSKGSLQSFTCPNNSIMPIGNVTALTDLRDNETYAVAKLADGKCWMIENLRLDYDADFTESLSQGFGKSTTYGDFIGLATPETAHYLNDATANSIYYSGTQSGTATINIGTSSNPGHRIPRYRNDNTSSPVSNMVGPNANIYSYGNYYNFPAVIASTTYYGTNNYSVSSTSICPSGWRLPTAGKAYAADSTSGVNVTGDTSTFREWYNLGYILMGSNLTAYEDTLDDGNAYYSNNTLNPAGDTGSKAFRKYPNNFIYSGGTSASDGISITNRGIFGGFWASAIMNSTRIYDMYMRAEYVYPGTSPNHKFNARPVRCIAAN